MAESMRPTPNMAAVPSPRSGSNGVRPEAGHPTVGGTESIRESMPRPLPGTVGSGRACLRSGTGSLTVTRSGGRVQSLVAAPGLPNLLYSGTAATGVLGGDRLWPAPEVKIFYETREGSAYWRCPPELDPGAWSLDGGNPVQLAQSPGGATLERLIWPLEGIPVACELPWAGYRVVDRVTGKPGWSAWHIVVVPAPARIFVREAQDAVTYYHPAPAVEAGWTVATGDLPRWKIGFPPPRDGRLFMAALGTSDPGPLVTISSTAPVGGTFVDTPPAGGQGTASQIYNSAGEGFCELEHHAPLESGSTDSLVLGAWGSLEDRLFLLDRLANLA